MKNEIIENHLKNCDILISRESDNGTQTTGHAYVKAKIGFEKFCTLELPWKSNKKSVSCIPAGAYWAKPHASPKHGRILWIQGVPGRTEILIHPGNFHKDIQGCILVGMDFRDINGDGQPDATDSRKAMNRIFEIIGIRSNYKVNIVNEIQ